MKRIVSRGILTLGVVAVLLAATAASASASETLDPVSTDFGDREVGTTSPAQAFTLTVGPQCFSFPIIGTICFPDSFAASPSVSGEFAQTNNCPATLDSLLFSSCTINVTFNPTSTGPKAGTLSTGPGGPTATLAGNGVDVPTPPTPPDPGPPPPEPEPIEPGGPGQPGAPGAQPLTLDLDAKKQELKKKLTFFATANLDSTLVAEGSVKQTTKQLVANEKTKVKASLKSKARKKLDKKLDKSGKAKAKVEAGAATAAGSSTIDEIKVKLKD
jgi:hypothetical protein